jgi:hypothetical protein
MQPVFRPASALSQWSQTMSSHPNLDPASGRHPAEATEPPPAGRGAARRPWPGAAATQPPASDPLDPGGEAGQATAEYALVMLAAAALAGLLLAWAASTDGISRLLDHVINSIISNAG